MTYRLFSIREIDKEFIRTVIDFMKAKKARKQRRRKV